MSKKLKLEVGKTYRNREGGKVRIVRKSKGEFPFIGEVENENVNQTFKSNGSWQHEDEIDECDLVEEWNKIKTYTPGDEYQDLFNYISTEFDNSPLESQMQDVIDIVIQMQKKRRVEMDEIEKEKLMQMMTDTDESMGGMLTLDIGGDEIKTYILKSEIDDDEKPEDINDVSGIKPYKYKGWVVANANHPAGVEPYIVNSSYSHTKRGAIEKFIEGSNTAWSHWYKKFNFRCVRAIMVITIQK